MSNKPGKHEAQETSSTVVKFPVPGRWANSPKEHTKKICTFAFKQVNRDHELSAHARSVAIDIAEHVNWKNGYAEVSTLETAKRLGYTEKTVIDARDQVVARGHFEFTPGKAGRGHSARYRPILKLPIPGEENLRAAQYYDGDKTCVSRQENLRPAEIKPAPDAVEQSYNNLSNNKSAPSGARTCYADREERAFQELIELRPLTHPSQEPAARAAFGALIKTAHIEDILDDACGLDERVPKDCVNYLASLTSNKPLTAASS